MFIVCIHISDMITTTLKILEVIPEFGASTRWIFVISFMLVYCTAFIKPIIYVYSNKFFKKAFYDTFPFCKTKNEDDIQLHNVDKDCSSDTD